MARALRPLLLAAMLLALVILGSSATLRLAANGIGCSPWPGCYGLADTASAVQGSSLIKALRLTHRLTASTFALLALAIVLLGWRGWARPSRLVALTMLLVTGVLAWVGLHTPSPLPAVTVINVLGGLALVGLSTALLYSSSPAPAATASEASPFLRRALWAVLALLALQAAVGAMISARLAASACASGCEQLEWSAKVTELLNPMLIGRVEALAVEPTAGQSLHWLHRILGAALLVAASVMVYVLGAASGAALRRLAWVLAATFAMGVAGAVFDGHLLVTVVHALLAGLAAAAVGITLMAALRPRAARS
jgi:cytochrome c oxidase assembly protein subunit 15